MVKNPDAPPPTRAQTLTTFAGRHSEVVALVTGLVLGVGATLLGVLTGGR